MYKNQVLPKKIGDLRNLKTLIVKNNLLSIIPRSIQSLTELVVFDCSINQIAELPSLQSLQKLKYLQCFDNTIKKIENLIGPENYNLELLNLSHNFIPLIPDSITNIKSLTYLDMDRNQIKEIPNTISGLKFLQTLRLENNQILSIPNAIGELENLKEFFVKNNSIQNLPASIASLPLRVNIN